MSTTELDKRIEDMIKSSRYYRQPTVADIKALLSDVVRELIPERETGLQISVARAKGHNAAIDEMEAKAREKGLL